MGSCLRVARRGIAALALTTVDHTLVWLFQVELAGSSK